MPSAYGRTAAAAPTVRARRGPAPPPPDPDRSTAVRLAAARAGLPAYGLNLATVRGRCRARRCRSRWGVIRVTVDLRGREVDRFAHVECAACGRVWRRTRIVPMHDRHSRQTVLATAILPASAHRWYARGRWHREGDDAHVLREASLSDLDEAARAFRARQGRVLARLQRARDRRQELEAAAMTRYRALRERLDDITDAQARIEAAAQAREVAA